MAYRELGVTTIREVLRRRLRKQPLRGIAATCHVDRQVPRTGRPSAGSPVSSTSGGWFDAEARLRLPGQPHCRTSTFQLMGPPGPRRCAAASQDRALSASLPAGRPSPRARCGWGALVAWQARWPRAARGSALRVAIAGPVDSSPGNSTIRQSPCTCPEPRPGPEARRIETAERRHPMPSFGQVCRRPSGAARTAKRSEPGRRRRRAQNRHRARGSEVNSLLQSPATKLPARSPQRLCPAATPRPVLFAEASNGSSVQIRRSGGCLSCKRTAQRSPSHRCGAHPNRD